MVTITVDTRLEDARDRLFRVADELRNSSGLGYDSVSFAKCVRRRMAVANAANKTGMYAQRLIKSGQVIWKHDPIRKRAERAAARRPPPLFETFRRFRELPAELRLLIWEAAAQPPTCHHYYTSYSVGDRVRPPAAHLMQDGGLWSACLESRDAIAQAYKNMYRKVMPVSCHVRRNLEDHYSRLGRYNHNGRLLQQRLCAFHKKFKDRFPSLGFISPGCLGDLYQTYPTEEEDRPFGEEMIRWGSLFAPAERLDMDDEQEDSDSQDG